MKTQQIIKYLTPPIILDIYKQYMCKYGFFGNFPSWDDAVKSSNGYDSDVILNKVKNSLLKVKEGKAAYERDSVIFDKIQYSWPLLTGLLWIASRNENRLNLVDFGGSLGSAYYQNKKFLMHLHELKWSIIEQPKFVECGKQYFENENVRFYYTLEDCIKKQNPDTILLSSVLQYLEKPYDLLEEIIDREFKYIILDRTPFLETGEDKITIQKVSPEIYRATYPAWIFNFEKFLKFFSKNYELVSDFESTDRANINTVTFRGFIFRIKQNA